ncbi:hypothetical protein [Niastella populi]|uniref:Uncharacterized protein n=1 Tax=Niastella populi TaxID=550983 RepID=A0A1V9FXG6_9BACT|nr:hypothetical protein [Niastella populi]OQP63014.1 hypothetical protein A4R26_17710 [Niastella populi]
MRSLPAFICLTVFFALQYGKLASYWQCRFASLYTSTRCDCVQQLLDKDANSSQLPSATLKEKTVEITLFHEQIQQWQSPAIPLTHEMAYTGIIPAIHTATIFQPPRFSPNA